MLNNTQSSHTTRGKHAISVSELNRQARTLLERSFLTIQVEGEISNFVKPSSGHWYFTLKDDKAQVRCAMFKNRNQLLPAPKQGDKVIVRAKVSLYEGRGDYQLICDFMESSGNGSLQAAFDALKGKLQQEGLFDSSYKKPIPKHPSHIGVITSSTGAAVHDILTVLKRRFPGLPVTIYPTAVQGEDASAQICKALLLAEVHNECDVLILGRGGGSLEDLSAFNNEQVARAVFDCDTPIISAVGHEVDVVITDFIADIRAPTPSAAAEMLSPDQEQLSQKLTLLEQRFTRQFQQCIERYTQKISNLKARLRHPDQQVREQSQRLDHLELRFRNAIHIKTANAKHTQQQLTARLNAKSPQQLLERKEAYIHSLYQRLLQANQGILKQNTFKLSALAAQLNTVSPLATLERGYAIVKDKEDSVIQDASTQKPGNIIEAQLYNGRLRCRVDEVITE
jgi:exodeoxyribonuclease VII large subunit